jgi:predicted dienelactone hydrolase
MTAIRFRTLSPALAWTLLLLTGATGTCVTAEDGSYDPLMAPAAALVQITDLSVLDAGRDREIPIRVYQVPGTGPLPVVLFSHGLGGSRENNPYLGNHWAARGYLVVFLQHPGSDASVWRDEAAGNRYAALADAANLQNFMLRVKDVPAVLDQLGRWNEEPGHPLAGRVDLARVGMSGHSFGAVTTQAVSGQEFASRAGVNLTDPRILAAVAFSPSAPRRGTPARAFGSVTIPWMLMTGTEDTAPIGNIDVESRLAVFPALPPGGKYEVVLFGAQHSAFGDRALPGDRNGRNPNHHRVILALSTAFWDAYLQQDAAARAWLDGEGPAGILEPEDRWQKK